jgi:GntR family transcriptional regulator
VLSLQTIEAHADVAEQLEVDEGSPVHERVRLRSAGGEPIAKMTNYLPERLATFTEEDLGDHGLYDLIRRQGIVLHSATQTLGARNATAAESRMLDEPKGAALITAQRVTYDDHGSAVEFGTHIYAASRYTFEVQLFT